MDEQTEDILNSVIETLMKKEAEKFRNIIQKELESKVYFKIEELKKFLSSNIADQPSTVSEVPMSPSAPVATTPTNDMDTMGTGSPKPTKPIPPKKIKLIPTTAGQNKDDVTLDPNFEKEFYLSSYTYRGQRVIIKQVGTGFGKPVRIYINDRRWEFFPGPKSATKATKEYIDQLMKDAKNDDVLAINMTKKVEADKRAGFAEPPPEVQTSVSKSSTSSKTIDGDPPKSKKSKK
jgi:hypothetical protein